MLTLLERDLPSVPNFFRNWYPVFLMPFLYKEVEVLAGYIGDWGLTRPVQQLEVAIFGGHPSIYLSEVIDSVFLSEYLHFCYLSHVLMVPAIAGYFYAIQNRAAFHELLLLFTVNCLVSYFFFSLYPVDSPFYLFASLDAKFSGYPFYDLVHYVADRGGARGGAFPSCHVSVTTVVWLVLWKWKRAAAVGLLPIMSGLVFATVYGRFHYVLDVLAGFFVAMTVVWLCRRLLI
jgi:membrane-associated phospholipid phosphatase